MVLSENQSYLALSKLDGSPSLTGRKLLLKLLNKVLGISELPEISKTPLGKPFFSDRLLPSFNISHSKSHIAVYLGNKQAVGCDIERIYSRPNWQDLAKAYFSKKEVEHLFELNPLHGSRLFWRYWTTREAWIKQQGKSVWDMASFSLNTNKSQLSVVGAAEYFLHLTYQQQQLSLCNTQAFTKVKSCQALDTGLIINYEHSMSSENE